MLEAARISAKEMRNHIMVFSVLNSLLFVIITLGFKYMNLLHLWELRISNFVLFGIVSILQVRRWIKSNRGFIPFLQVFLTVLTTGAGAFLIFAGFMFVYSFWDPYLAKLFITDSSDDNKFIPAIIVFFEGTGASIIASLMAAIYSSKFEDGEAPLPE